MKYLTILSILFISLLLSSCKKDSVEISSVVCTYADSSKNHPKHAVYSSLVEKYHQKGFPGFVLFISNPDEGLWMGTSGYAKIETEEKMKPCHLHHSASISKMYVATTILALHSQGKLDINKKADTYLPDNLPSIANVDLVTIKHLLNHTSGIPDFRDDLLSYIHPINDPEANESWRDYLEKYVEGEDAYFEPGTDYRYSNTNYLLLGLIIENVSAGRLGETLLQLLQPAGLLETYYQSSPGYPDIKGVTNNYFTHYNGYLQNGTAMQQHFAEVAMGHEGIVASPRDYVLFMEKLMQGAILDSTTLDIMLNFRATSNGDEYVGPGIFSYPTPFGNVTGHRGGGLGTMTFLFYIPEKETTVFFASNLGSIFENELSDIFYDEILNEITEKIYQ